MMSTEYPLTKYGKNAQTYCAFLFIVTIFLFLYWCFYAKRAIIIAYSKMHLPSSGARNIWRQSRLFICITM